MLAFSSSIQCPSHPFLTLNSPLLSRDVQFITTGQSSHMSNFGGSFCHLISITLKYKFKKPFSSPCSTFHNDGFTHTHTFPLETNEHTVPEDTLGMRQEGRERRERHPSPHPSTVLQPLFPPLRCSPVKHCPVFLW